jgi:rSAM/selenodomain-associated transferase 1
MNQDLLVIIFVKNSVLGKVKTRLAKSIGSHESLLIYNRLLDLTESATSSLPMDKIIYYSEVVDDSRWLSDVKMVQQGEDIGERMKNAFQKGFDQGYKKIVLIGSDLPDISDELIRHAFLHLENKDMVFGPAADGGYYLVGLSSMTNHIFEHKPWSEPELLEITLAEIKKHHIKVGLLSTLNDIDTFEDLIASKLYKEYLKRTKDPVIC